MADVSKEQLKKEIAAILKNADLTKTSAKKVRTTLEEKLEVDLADQKKVVDDLVMEYLNEQQKPKKKGKKNESADEDEDDDENGDGGDSEEDSEEDKKKKTTKRAAPKKKKPSSDSEDEASADDNASDDEYSPKKKAKPAPKKKSKKKASDSDSDEDWGKTKKRGGGGGRGGNAKGYTRPLVLSKDLAKLMGQDQMPRHEVVKRMWALIKERNLYDPKNKQFAICDDELLKVIGEKRFRIFGMMKYLKGHFS